MRFRELIKQVGEWSQYNFGDQGGANALAPMAGLVEEYGEKQTASSYNKKREIADAYADMFIYLADICYRAGVVIDPDWESRGKYVAYETDVKIGRLAHCVLKTHQGIRKYADFEFARRNTAMAVALVFYGLSDEFFEDLGGNDIGLEELVSLTWESVRTRDWKKHPDNAHELADPEPVIMESQ